MCPVFSETWSAAFIQRHCQILMLRISFGLTLLWTREAKLHGIAAFDSLCAPPVWIRINLFLSFFLMQNTPFEFLSGCKLPAANQILHSKICSRECHLWSKVPFWLMIVSHNSMLHLLRYEVLTPAVVCHRALQMRFWYPKREICLDHLCLAVFGHVQIAASNGFCCRVLVKSVPPLHRQKFGR